MKCAWLLHITTSKKGWRLFILVHYLCDTTNKNLQKLWGIPFDFPFGNSADFLHSFLFPQIWQSQNFATARDIKTPHSFRSYIKLPEIMLSFTVILSADKIEIMFCWCAHLKCGFLPSHLPDGHKTTIIKQDGKA